MPNPLADLSTSAPIDFVKFKRDPLSLKFSYQYFDFHPKLSLHLDHLLQYKLFFEIPFFMAVSYCLMYPGK